MDDITFSMPILPLITTKNYYSDNKSQKKCIPQLFRQLKIVPLKVHVFVEVLNLFYRVSGNLHFIVDPFDQRCTRKSGRNSVPIIVLSAFFKTIKFED